MPKLPIVMIACAVGLGATSVLAQAPPPPPVPFNQTAPQGPEVRGVVYRFTLTPRGELDGFLLADNTDVHVPPHLSAQLAAIVHAGDTVSIRGYRAANAPLIVAGTVTNVASGQSVVDQGPPGPGFAPPPPPPPGMPQPGATQAAVQGKVKASLYGPAGDLNGAALEDGTIVRMPPHIAYQSVALLAPGQSISAQGFMLTTNFGRVVDAQAIQASP